MSAPALTIIPELVSTEAIIDDTIANGIVGVFIFRTKYPDLPAEVRVVVGPMAAADLLNPAVGLPAIKTARDAAFAASPGAPDSSALALS